MSTVRGLKVIKNNVNKNTEYKSERQALSAARLHRAGSLATADSCLHSYAHNRMHCLRSSKPTGSHLSIPLDRKKLQCKR